MHSSIRIFTICANEVNHSAISLNSNFLEANVINILLLLFGLIYVLKQFLGSALLVRQNKVLSAIQEAEERLQQANLRLEESEKQLAQTQIVIKQIEKEASITAQKVRESILEQGKLDIERLTSASKATLSIAENQVRQEIQQQIITLAISKVATQLQSQVTPVIQSKIVDYSIMQLGEKI
uniref:ATP synthase CF0 subunit I n=1 Tax=Hypnea pseudomusciformis TaxID=1545697 RepID=UPI0027DA95CE|nr:ATP synthase CF0 subunit I [Hypnea pseudomusciformis]WCH55121.1 ATP synthase CF0 subunit I [Hypnea pseudomusciformis]WCH55520.1 ATP synthase CF0 subunit I [Hypnea pseudomusciformis]WCH56714.1 ATP synthase CF0 subunit I [Hypnea pseudomusciformis]